MPAIVDSFRASVGQVFARRDGAAGGETRRTERDMPIGVVVGGSLVLAGIMWLAGLVDPFGAILVILFGFFFSVVSSRITGLVGSSSCPISGMTIATLMGTCFLFLLLGRDGHENAAAALLIGSIVCIALSNAGTTSQDLKTGFLVGATPIRQQIGLFIGVITSVAAIGFTMNLMNASETKIEPVTFASVRVPEAMLGETVEHEGATYRLARVHGLEKGAESTPEERADSVPNGFYFSTDSGELRYRRIDGIGSAAIPAPQSRLMELVISGLLERKLPWDLVLIGVAIALFMEILGMHSLTFAVGLYLPLASTAPIFLGGLVRKIADKRYKKTPDDFHETEGTLYASGLIAGSALVGVLAAGLSVVANSVDTTTKIDKWLWLGPEEESDAANSPLMRLLTVAAFSVLAVLLYRQARPAPERSEAH
jgi:uncharacterized oligopeptide transporter (OPT) family protein